MATAPARKPFVIKQLADPTANAKVQASNQNLIASGRAVNPTVATPPTTQIPGQTSQPTQTIPKQGQVMPNNIPVTSPNITPTNTRVPTQQIPTQTNTPLIKPATTPTTNQLMTDKGFLKTGTQPTTPTQTTPTQQEKTTVTTPEGTTTTVKETPTPTQEKITTIEQFKQRGGGLNNLEQFIEDRYGSIANQEEGGVTSIINGEKFKWSLDSVGNPIKTSLGKAQIDPTTGQETGLFGTIKKTATDFYNSLKNGVGITEEEKITPEGIKATNKFEYNNKYNGYTVDQFNTALENNEIGSELDSELMNNPAYQQAKAIRDAKLRTKELTNFTTQINDFYSGITNQMKEERGQREDRLSQINDQMLNIINSKGNDALSFRQYLAENSDLQAKTTELNEVQRQYRELEDQREQVLKDIQANYKGMPMSLQIALANKNSESINQQLRTMSYKLEQLSSDVKYETTISEKDFDSLQKAQESQQKMMYDYYGNLQNQEYQTARDTTQFERSLMQNQLGYMQDIEQGNLDFARKQAMSDLDYQRQRGETMDTRTYEQQKIDDARAYEKEMTAEERAYKEQKDIRDMQMKYDYTYGDINSTDPRIRDTAIRNAMNDMYESYKDIKGIEGQATKEAKVRDLIANGSTPAEALSQVEGEIRNSQRYKDYIASEKAKTQGLDYMTFNNNLYRTDNQGNITLAMEGQKEWKKLDDGTYVTPDGTPISAGELETYKLMDNKFNQLEVGQNAGVQCGVFATRSVGLNSTPGGNSIAERIKAFSDKQPEIGGLVFFNGGNFNKDYGHIAFIKGINPERGTMTIRDSNYDPKNPNTVGEREIALNNAFISGYYNNTPLAKSLKTGQVSGGQTGGEKIYTDTQKNLMSGIDVKNPTKLDLSILKQAGLSIEDAMNYKANQKKGKWSEGLDDTEFKRVNTLQSDFYSSPVAKNFDLTQGAYEVAKNVAKGNNATDNQALIYAFAKAMDPDSVVREGEYATVQKYSQTWNDKFGMNINRIMTGQEFISEEAKKNIVATIKSKYEGTKQNYLQTRDTYISNINDLTGKDIGGKVIPSNITGDKATKTYTDKTGKIWTVEEMKNALNRDYQAGKITIEEMKKRVKSYGMEKDITITGKDKSTGGQSTKYSGNTGNWQKYLK